MKQDNRIFFRASSEWRQRLDDYCNMNDFRKDRSAVIRLAVERFLDAEEGKKARKPGK